LRLCHVTAKCVEEAKRRLASAAGDDNRLADAYESAETLLSEKAIECDETRRRGHIEAMQALIHRMAQRIPELHGESVVYSPPQAQILLEALTTRTDLRGSDDRLT
jgi:hypothetical protein